MNSRPDEDLRNRFAEVAEQLPSSAADPLILVQQGQRIRGRRRSAQILVGLALTVAAICTPLAIQSSTTQANDARSSSEADATPEAASLSPDGIQVGAPPTSKQPCPGMTPIEPQSLERGPTPVEIPGQVEENLRVVGAALCQGNPQLPVVLLGTADTVRAWIFYEQIAPDQQDDPNHFHDWFEDLERTWGGELEQVGAVPIYAMSAATEADLNQVLVPTHDGVLARIQAHAHPKAPTIAELTAIAETLARAER